MAENQFIDAAVDITKKADNLTFTENGAVSYKKISDSELACQFGKAGSYFGRSMVEVSRDMEAIWEEDPTMAVRFIFYLRMITRKVDNFKDGTTTDSVQNGQGLRDEPFKRLLWLAKNHPKAFNEVFYLLPMVGSWKDPWTLMYYDMKLEGEDTNWKSCLDYEAIFDVILIYMDLDKKSTTDLIRKFMPRIKSKSHLKTARAKYMSGLAKAFVGYLNQRMEKPISYGMYNKMKTIGTAHDFQKLITNQMYDKIDWNKIPGKALLLLSTGNFISNHNLEKSYMDWLKKQPTVKFNGYPFELARRARDIDTSKKWMTYTIDKQFEQLLEKVKGTEIKERIMCALDTSGSMSVRIPQVNVSALDICESLGIYFASLVPGTFHDTVIMFDSTSHMRKLPDGGFCRKLNSIPCNAMGSTNFQSIIDLMVKVRTEKPDIPMEDYPTTILVVSDMQFNSTGDYWATDTPKERESNINVCREKLKTVFPEDYAENLRFIWWDCTSRCSDSPDSNINNEKSNSLFLSGCDGSIISLILGNEVDEKGNIKRMSMDEVVLKALSQEILTQITDIKA